MEITQAEADLICGRMHRRMMRLPALPKQKCPVKLGRLYTLRVKATEQRELVTIIEEPRRERLAAMSVRDANREGYVTVLAAVDAWSTRWSRYCGTPDEQLMVWVVSFARGDHRELMSRRNVLYLSPGGGYTTGGDRLHAGAVLDPKVAERMARDAAEEARKRRTAPQRAAIDRAQHELQTCRDVMLSMKANNRLRIALKEVEKLGRQLDKLKGEIPAGDLLPSASPPASESTDRSADCTPTRTVLASPELAA